MKGENKSRVRLGHFISTNKVKSYDIITDTLQILKHKQYSTLQITPLSPMNLLGSLLKS